MVFGIDTLLAKKESEWLDFKREYPGSTVELLHDILCLCNAYSDSDRFLVFGIRDDKSVQGIEIDQNRKKNSDIQDMLRQANLNRIPTVRLCRFSVGSHEVDVLKIKNRPDKPFFLLRDKMHDKQIIRAGVVYTRIGDTNIPLKETALEDHIELMWRERFGLGLPPLTRIYQLLDDTEHWITFETTHGSVYRYHQFFPEFTIQELIDQDARPHTTPWSRKLPDPGIYRQKIEIRYLGTILKQLSLASCDGGRYMLPCPKRHEDGSWQVDADSFEYKVASLYKQWGSFGPLPEALLRCDIQIVHLGKPFVDSSTWSVSADPDGWTEFGAAE